MQLPNKYKTVLQPRGAASGHHELNNAELTLLGLARRNFRVRVKHAELRRTDTVWNIGTTDSRNGKKVGKVPDFDALHMQWEARLTAAREEAKARLLATCPQVRSAGRKPKMDRLKRILPAN
jgi:hypothetical protein